MRFAEIAVDTRSRQIVDCTAELARFVAGGGDGLLLVFVPHATAGLAVIETGSGSEADLLDALDRLLPRDDRYRHRHGSLGHGADHLLPMICPPALTVAVRDGHLVLGTWQSVVMVDRNVDNPRRRLQLSLLSDAGRPSEGPGGAE